MKSPGAAWKVVRPVLWATNTNVVAYLICAGRPEAGIVMSEEGKCGFSFDGDRRGLVINGFTINCTQAVNETFAFTSPETKAVLINSEFSHNIVDGCVTGVHAEGMYGYIFFRGGRLSLSLIQPLHFFSLRRSTADETYGHHLMVKNNKFGGNRTVTGVYFYETSGFVMVSGKQGE